MKRQISNWENFYVDAVESIEQPSVKVLFKHYSELLDCRPDYGKNLHFTVVIRTRYEWRNHLFVRQEFLRQALKEKLNAQIIKDEEGGKCIDVKIKFSLGEICNSKEEIAYAISDIWEGWDDYEPDDFLKMSSDFEQPHQLIKEGFIYILSNAELRNVYKIGYSKKNVQGRAKSLKSETRLKTDFVIEKYWATKHPFQVEQQIHKALGAFCRPRKFNDSLFIEFFEGDIDSFCKEIEKHILSPSRTSNFWGSLTRFLGGLGLKTNDS